jgi:hypothetical protein
VPTPPPAGGYTSRNSLVHWWAPGRDLAALGKDFAARGVPVDVAHSAKGLGPRDVVNGGGAMAFVDLDGKNEFLGNNDMRRYGIGDTWTLSAWVRPDKAGNKKKARYIVDINGETTKRCANRISLVLDPSSRFAIEISDAAGRVRALPAVVPIDEPGLGSRWYLVTAVKSGGTLTLYVDGRMASRTDVGVPSQGDVDRVVRVGTRVKHGAGFGFAGGVHSVGLWNAALGATEIRALYANGNRAFDPR